MQVRLLFHDVIERTESEVTLSVSPDTSVSELLTLAGFPSGEIDLDRYYAIPDAYSQNGQVLPYILVEARARWEVFYGDVTIGDTVQTLCITDEPVRVNVGFPQAGGPGVADVLTLWQNFYDAIRAVDPLVGVGGAFYGIVAFFRRVFRRRRSTPPESLSDVPPGAVFSLVLSKEAWNHHELADVAVITQEDAKHLLRLCGYKWDRRQRNYRRTADTERIVAALNRVDQHDE